MSHKVRNLKSYCASTKARIFDDVFDDVFEKETREAKIPGGEAMSRRYRDQPVGYAQEAEQHGEHENATRSPYDLIRFTSQTTARLGLISRS